VKFPRIFCGLPATEWNIGYTVSGTVREILAQGETWEHPHDFMVLKPGGSHAWEVPRDAREPWLQAELKAKNSRIDRRVQKAIELFSKRLAKPSSSIPEAAAACGLSQSRLTGLFRKHIGMTPQTWLERIRLKHAKNLLVNTGLPVKSISDDCGYGDQRHFATRFRRMESAILRPAFSVSR